MESDYSTLCNELDNIFLECPTDKSGCAEVRSLIDAFVNKYGNEKPQLRSIISDKLDPQGFNPSISRSCFKRWIMEWIVSCNQGDSNSHYTESTANVDRDVFEYDTSSYAHSTPLGRFNQRFRKIPKKILSYSPAIGFTSDSSENNASPYQEEFKSYRSHSKAHNSSLENSLVKAEQKIFALEEELKAVKLNSRKDTERLKEEIDQLKTFEKMYAGSVNKIEKYAETLNNLTKEYNRLKNTKEDLFKEFTNLEIDHQRLKDEIDSKNISLKALETWKRVQTEELVVLNDSKNLLENEVFKLKNDVKSHTQNEESLLLRIGELQSEKQKLQTELDEVMNFEKLKMVTSSPFRKSLSNEDEYMDRSEENRESGISVRSELMDSLGFASCVNETFHLPYLSVLNRTDSVSFTCGATALDLLSEKSQRMEQDIATYQMEEMRLKLIEKEVQTETIHENTRLRKGEIGVQTDFIKEKRILKVEQDSQTELMYEERILKVEMDSQTDIMCEARILKVEKDSQTDIMSETRILKVEMDSQTDIMCEARILKVEKDSQTDIMSETRLLKVETDSQTDIMCEARILKVQKGSQTDIMCEARISKVEKDSQTDIMCEARDSLEDVGVNTFQWSFTDTTRDCLTPTKMDIDNSLEELHRSISNFTYHGMTEHDGCELTSDNNGRLTNASVVNVENDSIHSSSSDISIPRCEFIRVLRKPNMSTPRLRIRRMESRRLSCLDVYNQPVSISRPKLYQKLTLSEERSFNMIGNSLLDDRRSKSNIWICMKTLVWLVTAALMIFIMVIVLFIMTTKHDWISKLYFLPYLVLKYPYGPPPS